MVCFLMLLVFTSLGATVAEEADRFTEWYDTRYDIPWRQTINENCQSEYQFYLDNSTMLIEEPDSVPASIVTKIVSCILRNTDESVKANMQAAGILLGLAPAILAYISPSPIETAALATVGRRPFFALCIAAGSPFILPIRPFTYPRVDEFLYRNLGPSFRSRNRPAQWRWFVIVTAQYLLAGCCIANVVILGRQLGQRGFITWASGKTYLPLLWTLLAPMVHILNCLTTRLRVNIVSEPHSTEPRRFRTRVLEAVMFELSLAELSSAASQPILRTESIENPWTQRFALVLSWSTAFAAILHIFWGSLTLSSILLLSTLRASFIVAQYMGSVLCCQALLAFELARLQEVHACGSEREKSRAEGGVCARARSRL